MSDDGQTIARRNSVDYDYQEHSNPIWYTTFYSAYSVLWLQ